jgi:hypothetical protein
MKRHFLTGTMTVCALAAGAFLQASPAEAAAVSFGFQNIFSNDGNTAGDTIVNNFSFNVDDGGTGTVLFKIINGSANPSGSFISRVYFDDIDASPLLSNMALNVGNQGTVAFSLGATNFAQGNNTSPPFDQDFGATRNEGSANGNAVQPGEALGVTFTGNLAAVIAALNAGSLRLGIRVQGLSPVAGFDSDSFVSAPSNNTPVPTPALLPGLVGLGVAALRKKKQAAEATQDA